tara:strand:+ start:54 stop:584 length:531 start_codon:yes stop_codon:yes gene_type:complete
MNIRNVSSFIVVFLFSFVVNSQVQGTTDTKQGKALFTTPEVSEVNIDVIIPPEGFEISPAFNGYIHYQASSAVIINLINKVNFKKLAEGMNQEFFDKNKLRYISEKKIITNSGTKGIWYKFNFKTEGKDFCRYIVYAGDLNKTLWLNFTYPLKLEDLVENEILNSIQTIDLRKIKK